MAPILKSSVVKFPAPFRLPRSDQQISIMGRNGSGKTQFATWILSHGNFERQPYVVIDYKYDDLINNIPRIKEIGLTTRPPKFPGLYIVHPRPDEAEAVEAFLWAIWERENIGVYIDEAHMLPNKGAFQALLTQGRSKHIPRIVLTQRPAWVNRFVFSEANFYAVFHLNDWQDQRRVQDFVPVNLRAPLPRFQSWYHYVDDYRTFRLLPVPDRGTILERFEARAPRHWFGSGATKRRRM